LLDKTQLKAELNELENDQVVKYVQGVYLGLGGAGSMSQDDWQDLGYKDALVMRGSVLPSKDILTSKIIYRVARSSNGSKL
jgi:hypothetical protein